MTRAERRRVGWIALAVIGVLAIALLAALVIEEDARKTKRRRCEESQPGRVYICAHGGRCACVYGDYLSE